MPSAPSNWKYDGFVVWSSVQSESGKHRWKCRCRCVMFTKTVKPPAPHIHVPRKRRSQRGEL